MAELGRMNRLTVVKEVDFGVYLDGGDEGEILLPRKDISKRCQPGDKVEVFVYLDSEDLLIATMKRPRVMVGQCALLPVIDVNRTGAFLDWGLNKDLLVPFGEQQKPMQAGQSYVVYVYIDPASQRITASSKIDKFLPAASPYFKEKQQVELLIYARSQLGYKAVIDDVATGLIFNSDVFTPLKIGQKTKGYIKRIRNDNKVDLCLQLTDRAGLDALAEQILEFLQQEGGRTTLTEKSPPELIAKQFGVSKSSYKKALGKLYKQRKIRIEKTYIERVK